MFKKNLKTDILLFPILSLVFSFCVIFFAFHFSVQRYISDISKKSAFSEFSFFDYYYKNNDEYEIKKNGESLFFSKSFIFNENLEEILPPNTKSYDENLSRKISSILNNDKEDRKKSEFKLTILDQTYYVICKSYFGISDGFYIEKSANQNEGELYTVAVITNITYIQDFILKIRFIMTALMFFSGVFTIFVILRIWLKIDKASSILNLYILNVGKRIKTCKPKNLYYLEFDEIANSAFQMSKLINKSEESQKIFFQNASHELKTPLMSIQGYAEGIKTGILSDTKAASSIIINESKKMSNLVNEILLLSKIDSNYDKWDTSEFNLKDLIYNCFHSIKAEAELKKITIYINFQEEHILINANESLFEKAILNILSNALRYAKANIYISCSLENNYKKINIRDDGDGIKKDVLPYIFERFYKGDGGSTGIGLSITKEVINKYQGHIKVNSDENGSEFIIYLP